MILRSVFIELRIFNILYFWIEIALKIIDCSFISLFVQLIKIISLLIAEQILLLLSISYAFLSWGSILHLFIILHKIYIFIFLLFCFLIYILRLLRTFDLLKFFLILRLRKYLVYWFLKKSLGLNYNLIKRLTLNIWACFFILIQIFLRLLHILILIILYFIFNVLDYLFLVYLLLLYRFRWTILILLFLIDFAFLLLYLIWNRVKINSKPIILVIYSINNFLTLNREKFLKMKRLENRKYIKS
jgi:hypothetical protein